VPVQRSVIHFAIAQCSLGAILLAQSQLASVPFCWGRSGTIAQQLQDQFPKADLQGDEQAFEQQMAAVISLIDKPQQGLDCHWTFGAPLSSSASGRHCAIFRQARP
jgi:AraC family transcriptional regulator of adaptative response/methylated-DNA-[protein]-cysteine methyltransferase